MTGISASIQLADQIIRHAVNTNDYLMLLETKSPQQVLNDKLNTLVRLVSPTYGADFANSVLMSGQLRDKISHLRFSLYECEYELERHWAARIISGKNTYADYPYISNYEALVASEKSMLDNHASLACQHVCFIGLGPMPLSAFELKKAAPGLHLHCVEMEEEAIHLSQQVSAASGVGISYIHSPAQNVDYSSFDVVFVAGMTSHKKEVLSQISQTARNGTLIGARSVEELRHMLYEPLAPEDVPATFEYLGKTGYQPEHVNTTLLYRLSKN